jgi:hypothetical protein
VRFQNRIDSFEFNRRVEELVKNFEIRPKDAVHIVRDFEHSFYADTKDAEKDFKLKIKEAQKIARKKYEKAAYSPDPFPETRH